MSDHADEFVRKAPGVRAATSEREGAYVHVYRGELADTQDRVRFLTLAPDIDDGSIGDRFSLAAGKWGNADTHPNIVSVYASGDEPRPWVAVADVGGQPLDAVRSSLTPTERRAVILDVGEALRNAALYNTFHQDLRPDRVWVVPTDGGVTALVDEWGLERAVRAAVGDPDLTLFTAPEAVADSGSVDERTDVYGLGAVAYYTLTGQPPVTAGADITQAIGEGAVTPPSDLDDSLSADVEGVLLRALATDPAERYDSAYAFTRAFEGAYTPPGDDEAETVTAGGVAAVDGAETGGKTRADADSEDDESFLTRRRAVLGTLAVGSLGLGGGWMAGRMGDDGGDGAGPAPTPIATSRPTPTEASREAPTETPTEATADLDISLPAHDGLAYHDGSVYLVDQGLIKTVDRESGEVTNSIDVPDGSRPRGLAFGDGSLWFADRIGPDYEGEIAELDPETGAVRSSIRSSWDPRGLAFGDGSLWAVNITSNRIVEYSPGGETVSAFGTGGVSWGLGLAYFEGTLWLGNNCNGNGCTVSLREYSTDGELLQETGRRTEAGYGGLAATETELLGPDADGMLTVLGTL